MSHARFYLLGLLLSVFSLNLWAADGSILGQWQTIDESGEKKSIVEIYEQDGQFFGKIIKLFPKPDADPNPLCIKCEGARKDQPVVGMVIIENMEKPEGEDRWKGGTILDPKKGATYDCELWLEEGKLQVRGYVAFFYRTQTWLPVK